MMGTEIQSHVTIACIYFNILVASTPYLVQGCGAEADAIKDSVQGRGTQWMRCQSLRRFKDVHITSIMPWC